MGLELLLLFVTYALIRRYSLPLLLSLALIIAIHYTLSLITHID